MSYGRGKRDNEYSKAVYGIDAPKTVWMAIAFSLAQRMTGDDAVDAAKLCADEWRVLHENGIVPQKPRVAAPAKDPS